MNLMATAVFILQLLYAAPKTPAKLTLLTGLPASLLCKLGVWSTSPFFPLFVLKVQIKREVKRNVVLTIGPTLALLHNTLKMLLIALTEVYVSLAFWWVFLEHLLNAK